MLVSEAGLGVCISSLWKATDVALHYPMAMDLHKGHKVTKNMSKPRPDHHHGYLTKHTVCYISC